MPVQANTIRIEWLLFFMHAVGALERRSKTSLITPEYEYACKGPITNDNAVEVLDNIPRSYCLSAYACQAVSYLLSLAGHAFDWMLLTSDTLSDRIYKRGQYMIVIIPRTGRTTPTFL